MNRLFGSKKFMIAMIAVLGSLVLLLPAAVVYSMDLSNYSVSIESKQYEYTGEEITPEIQVKKGPLKLKEGQDYTVDFLDNQDVGEARYEIEATGRMSGDLNGSFEIVKANQAIEGETSFEKNIQEDLDLGQTAMTSIKYESSDESVLKIDKKGNAEAFKPGEVDIHMIAVEDDFYYEAEKDIHLTITETPTQEVIRESLEWARMIAADDSYTYGHGQCPKCHNVKKVYDCVAFMTAAYWHGGEAASLERWCKNHNYVSKVRMAMINSKDWKGVGKLSLSELEPGDVLYYKKGSRGKDHSGWFHVEIYNGNGEVVGAHTFGHKRCISVEPFNNYFKSYTDVYRYVGE